MTTAAISIGSNLGDRVVNLRSGVEALGREVSVVRESRLYETDPMYVKDQPPFMNGAILVNTDLGPVGLLKLLKEVERTVGRTPGVRYGPREIDLDLITYGRLRYEYNYHAKVVLALPHPRVAERRFVIQPLFDLDPDMILPGVGPISRLMESTESQAATVRELSDALLPVLRG